MTGLSNSAIAKTLERLADLLEREPTEATRPAACREAAETLRHDVRPLTERIEDDGVEGIHRLGIGYELSGLIADWVRTGELDLLRRLEERAQARAALRTVPGIGARLATEVELALGITTVTGLASASSDGRLAALCGFGPRRLDLIAGVVGGAPTTYRRERRRPEQLVMTFAR